MGSTARGHPEISTRCRGKAICREGHPVASQKNRFERLTVRCCIARLAYRKFGTVQNFQISVE